MKVKYMLVHGLAKPCASDLAPLCLLLYKADRSPRFCTDYRKDNSVTKPDAYLLPQIEDSVDQVSSANFVRKFDLLKGYWQVPLSRRAKDISAFIISFGLFSYYVMSFSLQNAPAMFQWWSNQPGGLWPGQFCSLS